MSGQFVLRGGSCGFRGGTCAQAIAIFSIRTSAGSLPASASQRISSHAPYRPSSVVRRRSAFRHDVLNGLAAGPRMIPPRWFYDREGSALFEEITMLPESLSGLGPSEGFCRAWRRKSPRLLEKTGRAVVEFGSGSCSKTPILLDALNPAASVPIDISGGMLINSATKISALFRDLAVPPLSKGVYKCYTAPAGSPAAPSAWVFPWFYNW